MAGSCWLECSRREEVHHQRQELVFALNLGPVTALPKHVQIGVLQQRMQLQTVRQRHDLVVAPMDHERALGDLADVGFGRCQGLCVALARCREHL